VRVSASIGMGLIEADQPLAEQPVFIEADRAMYEDKRQKSATGHNPLHVEANGYPLLKQTDVGTQRDRPPYF
jgi:hypothetical protein